MDMLSQIGFDDLLKDDEADHPSHPAGLSPAKLVTPRQPRTEAPCTTPSSKRTMSFGVPFAQRPFGIKKEIDEDDEQEKQRSSHTQDEEQEEEENDSSEDDSICEEAKQFAQTSQGMPTGWMKTQMKKRIKEYHKEKRTERDAKKQKQRQQKRQRMIWQSQERQAPKAKKWKQQQKQVISKITKDVTTSPRSIHDLTSVIIRTKLSQSFKHRPRTYMQGQTASMTPETQRWILITEITESQSPNHYELMRKVTH